MVLREIPNIADGRRTANYALSIIRGSLLTSSAFDADLIRRYDVNGPRYTSYPTANLFEEGDYTNEYVAAVKALDHDAPISLYLHVPFCQTICYYCACNKINTANHRHADDYIQRLTREMAAHAQSVPSGHTVRQLHFGGGTPTFLTDAQFRDVFDALEREFNLVSSGDRDYSIEIDPRKLAPERMAYLAALGFNRMSVGIQDFDPDVQVAVNRVQSEQETAAVVDAAREHGINSISFDLIYGLPRQTAEGFVTTLAKVLEMSPDRLSLYSYAHLPARFKTQRQIKDDELPTAEIKLDLMARANEFLASAGYQYIGMDHFAKPTDTLARAQHEGTLQRNFMGYTTHGDCELIGLGVSAISKVGNVYCQNAKTLDDYYAAVDAGQLPIERGLVATGRDLTARYVIQNLMCHFRLDFDAFEKTQLQTFSDFCGEKWSQLENMAEQGLLNLEPSGIEVTPRGRFLIRNVCMVFDEYLAPKTTAFSRAI